MRSIEEVIKFNDMIVNSGLNPRIQEFLVAINNCNVDPFERLAYAISQQDFEKKYGKFENRIQVRREIADHEFEFLDIKLDGKEITCTLLQTQNGVISNKTPRTEIFVDSDGNGKVSPLDPSKSVKVTTFRLENERIVNIQEKTNLVGLVLDMFQESQDERLYAFVQNFELYKNGTRKDLATTDKEITKSTRTLADGWKEETNIVRSENGVSFQINEYKEDRVYSTDIEVNLDITKDYRKENLNGKVVVTDHTYQGTQNYSKDSVEKFDIKNGQIIPNIKNIDGEGKE